MTMYCDPPNIGTPSENFNRLCLRDPIPYLDFLLPSAVFMSPMRFMFDDGGRDIHRPLRLPRQSAPDDGRVKQTEGIFATLATSLSMDMVPFILHMLVLTINRHRGRTSSLLCLAVEKPGMNIWLSDSCP